MTAKTVLIAHHDAAVRDRFEAALRSTGHQAVGVRYASELLARVRADRGPIHLLVVDLRLEDSHGVQLLRSIRQLAEGLPILVFSGSIATADEVRNLAGMGVVGYVNEHSAEQGIGPSLTPYLFPDNFNRRSGPRVVLDIPVSYQVGTTVMPAVSLNLGSGGLAIRTMSPLADSAKVRARFRLPGSKRHIETESRVAWSDGRAGMGVQFERLDPADQTAIDEFVDHAT